MMIRITPQMRILVAVDPVGFRCGIDGPGAALQTARRLGIPARRTCDHRQERPMDHESLTADPLWGSSSRNAQPTDRLGTGRSSCFRALSCVLCNVNCDLRHYLPRLPASDMGCRATPAPLVRLG